MFNVLVDYFVIDSSFGDLEVLYVRIVLWDIFRFEFINGLFGSIDSILVCY